MTEETTPLFLDEARMEDMRNLAILLKVPDTIILDIYQVSNDWEFILKVDALLEAGVKKSLKRPSLAASE
jgi:hypothetical protein